MQRCRVAKPLLGRITDKINHHWTMKEDGEIACKPAVYLLIMAHAYEVIERLWAALGGVGLRRPCGRTA